MKKENQNDKKVLYAVCEKCKSRFNIFNKNILVNKREFDINGKKIFLTYYDCPKCKRRHFVQIDDETSLEQLNVVEEHFKKLAFQKIKSKQISKQQSATFNKARKDLSSYRMNLMKKYNEKLVYDDERGSYFILRFSV